MGEDEFPIQRPHGIRGWAGRTSIPWSLIAPHEQQAQRNHGQSLRRLAERGGLSHGEAVAVIEDREWSPMEQAEAEKRLEELVAAAPADRQPEEPSK